MLTGVILAGGQNRRMGGRNKALLTFSGKKLIQHQIDIMKHVCSEIIVVVNDPKPFLRVIDPSIKIITDYISGKGPLSGMHAALSLAKYNTLWVVASDMPYLSYEAALLMWEKKEKYEAVIPIVNGKLHPLHAIYDKSSLSAITGMLNVGDDDLTQLSEKLYCRLVDVQEFIQECDLRFVMDINTPEDYESIVTNVTAYTEEIT